MRVALVAVAVVLLGAPRPAVAGGCRTLTISASPLSTKATVVPGGGVLIGWSNDGDDDAPALDAVGRWGFTAGTPSVAAKAEVLAPGLTVIRPASTGARRLTLRDDHGKKQVAVTIVRKAPRPLPAPVATVETRRFNGGPRGGSSASAVARFAAVPGGAVAVIAYDARGNALAWARVGGSREVGLASTPGRCRPNPPGLDVPSAGQQLQLAWVDRHGRVSARSATIEVTEATP
ncbi:MAG: hypothetical protein JNK64_05600 [Myxococcales bacterium]|nr:hypothetical protein [Myxococcales bacterium]